METKILMMSMALTAMVFTSCNKESNETEDHLNGELRLSSGITAQQTRASFDMDKQIASGQTVAVYVDKATAPATEIYGNNELSANGNGAFTGGTTMFFPADKSNVDIYAFHTNGVLDDNYPAAVITHAVDADQSKAINYATSDLLYSAKKGVAFTKSAVELTFYHMLSKVEVALKVGAGTPELAGAVASIVGTKLKADFTPSKVADVTTQSARAAMITTTTADNTATEIKIGNTVSTDFETNISYNEAVIVPQEVAQNAQFIKVTLADGGELFHKLATATTFESGKKYSYQITVNLSSLTVTSTIEDWKAVNPVVGNAEME